MRLVRLVLACSFLAACSSPSSNSGAPDAAIGGPDAATGSCTGPGFGGNVSHTVGNVTATMHDGAGQPVSGLFVQARGINLAFTGTSNASGAVAISVNHSLDGPTFVYGDSVGYAELAAPIGDGDAAVGTVVVNALPPAAQGAALAAGASSTSNGVTLEVPMGGQVAIDELSYPTPADQTFRVVAVPVDGSSPGVDQTLGFAGVYGVAPLGTLFCPPARLHTPNVGGWAAGTAVEIFVHGIDVGQEFAPLGGWAKISDATVSASGDEIVTVDGGGVPYLSTFGIRKKP